MYDSECCAGVGSLTDTVMVQVWEAPVVGAMGVNVIVTTVPLTSATVLNVTAVLAATLFRRSPEAGICEHTRSHHTQRHLK